MLPSEKNYFGNIKLLGHCIGGNFNIIFICGCGSTILCTQEGRSGNIRVQLTWLVSY